MLIDILLFCFHLAIFLCDNRYFVRFLDQYLDKPGTLKQFLYIEYSIKLVMTTTKITMQRSAAAVVRSTMTASFT
jgi:hypothetical protein